MPPTVTVHGYDIDLDVLYRAMWDQAVEEQGVRVFKGNSRDVRSMKRLLKTCSTFRSRTARTRSTPRLVAW